MPLTGDDTGGSDAVRKPASTVDDRSANLAEFTIPFQQIGAI
jgi:hypothetical protein